LAAFLGHLFPIYLAFRGGKGVATGAGVVAVLLPGPALGAILTWGVVLAASRYVSLASLAAVAALCLVRFLATPEPFTAEHGILSAFCLVAAALVALRHHANIKRLLHGSENRLPESRTMLTMTKTLHVLALGLWFGSTVFFSLIAAPVIFNSFGSLADNPAERPDWFPPSFSKEQGSQVAGLAVGPIFPWFFLLQGVCGLVALATAASWSWSGGSRTVDRIRFGVLALALATVLAGWPLAQKVSSLRAERYSADRVIAESARAAFGTWHGYSLFLNFATLGLVTAGMALAARLPQTISQPGQVITHPSRQEQPLPVEK
jgi:hypothetical protein